MDKIRDLAITILCAALTFCILSSYIQWAPKVDALLDSSRATALQVRMASVSFKESSERTNKATKDWEMFFNDPAVQKSIKDGLFFLRSGPKLERTILATTNLINEFRDTNKYVQDALLPTITLATGRAIKQLETIGGASTGAINALKEQIANPNVQMLLLNLATAASSTKDLIDTTNLTMTDISVGVPSLVRSLQQIAANTTHSSYELTRFLKEMATAISNFNAPLTPWQKITRFLLQAVATSLPVLIRR